MNILPHFKWERNTRESNHIRYFNWLITWVSYVICKSTKKSQKRKNRAQLEREARAEPRKPRKEKQKGGWLVVSMEHKKKAMGFGNESWLLLMRESYLWHGRVSHYGVRNGTVTTGQVREGWRYPPTFSQRSLKFKHVNRARWNQGRGRDRKERL